MRRDNRTVIGLRRSHVLACGAIPLLLVLAGCPDQKESSKQVPAATATTPTPTPTPRKDDGVSTTGDELYKLRVENQKLSNLVATLRARKTKEEKESSTGVATEQTQNDLAKAQVDERAKLSELRKTIEELIRELQKRGQAQPPPALSPDDIKKITDAVHAAGGGGGDVTTQPVEPKGATDNDEVANAMKQLMKGAGLALCAAQPELCPLLGPIFEALNLFGSTEEREKFLDAVGAVAEGRPLTEAEAAAVSRVASGSYGGLHEGAKKVIEKMAEQSPAVADALKKGRDDMLLTIGISGPTYDDLRKVLESAASADAKLAKVQATFPVFANEKVRETIARLAEDLGGGKQLGDSVRKLGVN
jgi:hypothetical protein